VAYAGGRQVEGVWLLPEGEAVGNLRGSGEAKVSGFRIALLAYDEGNSDPAARRTGPPHRLA
jgi:hypothetical protein